MTGAYVAFGVVNPISAEIREIYFKNEIEVCSFTIMHERKVGVLLYQNFLSENLNYSETNF